jgi:hypothetical protein
MIDANPQQAQPPTCRRQRGPQGPSPWTPERTAELCRLWPTLLTARQIADQLGGVHRGKVIAKARQLGLGHKPRPIPRWTPEHIATLTRMWTAGEPVAAIGEALGGFSYDAVISRVELLQLPRRKPGGQHKPKPEPLDVTRLGTRHLLRRLPKPPPAPDPTIRHWCAQCERRQTAAAAGACTSQFCKLKG